MNTIQRDVESVHS